MYYEEKIIDGVLCYRNRPRVEFRPMTAEMITAKLSNLRNLVSQMKTEKNTLLNTLHRIQSVYDWQDDFAGKIAHEVLTQFNYSFNENGSIVSE